MNMISELRQRVRQNVFGAILTAEEFDQLQREWITRAGADDLVAAEREACASLCGEIARRKGERFFGELVSDGSAAQCETAIRERSNTPIR